MRSVLLSSLIFIGVTVQAQVSDTIFTFKEKIGCSVKEVGVDLVKYSYPSEDLMNTMPVTLIRKIIFKSGREQIFTQQAILKKVRYVVDWQNVLITKNEYDVYGLKKFNELKCVYVSRYLNDVKGAHDAAIEKLKKMAAIQGYKSVLISFEHSDFLPSVAKSEIVGNPYSDSIPTIDQIKAKISKSKLKVYTKHTFDVGTSILENPKKVNLTFRIRNVFEKNGFVYFDGRISDLEGEFKLVYMGAGFFVVHFYDIYYALLEYNFEISYE